MVGMTFEKPKTKRIYVQALDADTRRGKCCTIYNVTPEKFMEHVRKLEGVVVDETTRPRRAKQPA